MKPQQLLRGLIVTSLLLSLASTAAAQPLPLPAANHPPTNVNVSPSSGGRFAGKRVSFTTTYRDQDGWRDLRQVFLHIGRTKNKRNSCRVMYDLRRNRLYLLNNAGTRWLGGFAPGSAKVIRNSQCTLNCARTTVAKSGRTAKVRWNLVFRASFGGLKRLYLRCTDRQGGAAPWEKKGTWRVDTSTKSFEWEHGSGDGQIMPRSNASNKKTVWLHAGEWRALTFTITDAGDAAFRLRYSNDNGAGPPLEEVTLLLDGGEIYRFDAQNTYAGGPPGSGWNNFLWSRWSGSAHIAAGEHELKALVTGGDGFGVELDCVQLSIGS